MVGCDGTDGITQESVLPLKQGEAGETGERGEGVGSLIIGWKG